MIGPFFGTVAWRVILDIIAPLLRSDQRVAFSTVAMIREEFFELFSATLNPHRPAPGHFAGLADALKPRDISSWIFACHKTLTQGEKAVA